MSKRVVVGITALFLNLSPLALADPIDDASRQVGIADTKSASAATKITQVGKIVSAQQEVLIKLLRLIDDAQARHNRLMPLIDDSLKQADQSIVSAKQNLEQRERDINDAKTALERAKQRVNERRRAVDAATANERKAFESSAAFVDANKAVAAHRETIANLENDLEAGSAEDFAVNEAKAKVGETEKEMNALRAAQPNDAGAIAAASTRWIEAKNALEVAKQNLYSRHAPYAEAITTLREAQRTLSSLQGSFESTVSSLPGVADAMQSLKDASEDVQLRDKALDAAKKAIDRAQIQLERQQSQVTLIRKIKIESEVELQFIEIEVKRLQVDLRDLNQQLGDALDDLADVKKALKSVVDALRKADQAK